jgi:hypothetical protein
MPRGGKRPGAGRPRKPIPRAGPSPFDLADRLNDMARGSRGRRARFVLAMAAYGASAAEIAAALGVTPSQLTESDRDHMQTGLCVAQANLLNQIWKKAESGNVTAILWLHRRLEDRPHR